MSNFYNYNIHESFMSRAIQLARKGQGKVSPNPMVGCVLVKNGKIIGEGYHDSYGGAHAEVMAYKNAIVDPVDATVYVTLEPCCIFGKTPPCTKFLMQEFFRLKTRIYIFEHLPHSSISPDISNFTCVNFF